MKRGCIDIRLRELEKPSEARLGNDLEWLCQCLGLRQDKTFLKVLVNILGSAKKSESIRSAEIASKLHVTRGSVVYHLNKLMKSGIIVHSGNTYKLRARTLDDTIMEIEKDIERVFNNIREVSREIDNELKLPRRERYRGTEGSL